MTEQTSTQGVPDPVQPTEPSAVDGVPTDPDAPQPTPVEPVDPSHVNGEPTAPETPAEEQPNADVAGGDAFPQGGQTDVGTA